MKTTRRTFIKMIGAPSSIPVLSKIVEAAPRGANFIQAPKQEISPIKIEHNDRRFFCVDHRTGDPESVHAYVGFNGDTGEIKNSFNVVDVKKSGVGEYEVLIAGNPVRPIEFSHFEGVTVVNKNPIVGSIISVSAQGGDITLIVHRVERDIE